MFHSALNFVASMAPTAEGEDSFMFFQSEQSAPSEFCSMQKDNVKRKRMKLQRVHIIADLDFQNITLQLAHISLAPWKSYSCLSS